jgi:hypothetical protein
MDRVVVHPTLFERSGELVKLRISAGWDSGDSGNVARLEAASPVPLQRELTYAALGLNKHSERSNPFSHRRCWCVN